MPPTRWSRRSIRPCASASSPEERSKGEKLRAVAGEVAQSWLRRVWASSRASDHREEHPGGYVLHCEDGLEGKLSRASIKRRRRGSAGARDGSGVRVHGE